MAQQIKNPPAVQETQETQVWSIGWEHLLTEEVATHSSFLLKSPMDQGAWRTTAPKIAELDMTEQLNTHTRFITVKG